MEFVCGLFAGILLAKAVDFVQERLGALLSRKKPEATAAELSPEDVRRAEVRRRQMANFMLYEGDPMPEPDGGLDANL